MQDEIEKLEKRMESQHNQKNIRQTFLENELEKLNGV